MTRVRVCFPTTENVVFVDGIRSFPADKVPQSMMCRTGTSVAVVASGGYHAFVRSPTGCIERLFEHGRFRLDVSGPTDAGSSWELAVLMAHAAFAAGSLATAGTDPEAAPVLICATGQVGPLDLAVGEVAHVSHKVDLARPVLEAARARGQRVILAVPPGNRDDITSAARQALEAAGVEIVTPGNARSLAEAAGLALPRLAEAASRGYTPGTNPYRGLLAFGAEDRGVFFGRRRAREEAVAQLQTAAVQGRPFLLIHGRSGIGKSSLLRAGLAGDVPERLGQGRDWRVLTLSLRGPGPAGPAHRQILGVFGAGLDTARDALATLGPGAMVLLLLDQLEQALIELSAPEAAALGALLQGLVASQRVWVIGAIRSDQLDTLDRVPDLARLARDGRLYRLEPPTLFELGEMIRQPAALAGLMFLPGPHGEALPDRLAQVALEAPGSVPLLQVMLMQLAAMADRQGRIPFDAYDRLGGINDAVMRLAEEAVAALPKGLREADLLDRALSALIQIDQDGERVLARALDPQQDRPDVARLLAHLVDRRIVIAETGPPPAKGGQDAAPVTLRLAHETLITGWRRLAVLADRLREDIILRGWLEAVAVDWSRAHHDPGLLAASPARLAAARKAVDAARIAFPDQATRYLAAAERKLEATRRGQRRRRVAVAAGGMAILIATGLAAWNYGQGVLERRAAADMQALLRITSAVTESGSLLHDGRVDPALLLLLEAGTALGELPRSEATQDLDERLVIALDQAMARAESERRFVLAGSIEPILAPGAMLLHDSLSGQIGLVTAEGPQMLDRWFPTRPRAHHVTGIDGVVLSIEEPDGIAFLAVSPQGDVRDLSRLPRVGAPPPVDAAGLRLEVEVTASGVAWAHRVRDRSPQGVPVAPPREPTPDTAVNLITGEVAVQDPTAALGLLEQSAAAGFAAALFASGIWQTGVDTGGLNGVDTRDPVLLRFLDQCFAANGTGPDGQRAATQFLVAANGPEFRGGATALPELVYLVGCAFRSGRLLVTHFNYGRHVAIRSVLYDVRSGDNERAPFHPELRAYEQNEVTTTFGEADLLQRGFETLHQLRLDDRGGVSILEMNGRTVTMLPAYSRADAPGIPFDFPIQAGRLIGNGDTLALLSQAHRSPGGTLQRILVLFDPDTRWQPGGIVLQPGSPEMVADGMVGAVADTDFDIRLRSDPSGNGMFLFTEAGHEVAPLRSGRGTRELVERPGDVLTLTYRMDGREPVVLRVPLAELQGSDRPADRPRIRRRLHVSTEHGFTALALDDGLRIHDAEGALLVATQTPVHELAGLGATPGVIVRDSDFSTLILSPDARGVWSERTGPAPQEGAVRSLAAAPSGRFVALDAHHFGPDTSFRLFHLPSRREWGRFPTGGAWQSLAFTQEGEIQIISSTGGSYESFRIPTLPTAMARAADRVSEHCRPQDSAAWHQSRCWSSGPPIARRR